MKLSAESYLKGPIGANSITEVLCYNSKVTGLIINQYNLSEVSNKILDLGITADRNYIPTPLLEDGQGIVHILIEPDKHLAYAPSSGFDTLIYYVKLDEIRSRFPVGYSKLSTVIGNSTLTEVESIHYGYIRVNLTGLWKKDEQTFIPVDIGDREEFSNILDPLRTYLSEFKRRKDLDYSVKTEAPVEVVNTNGYQVLPFIVNNQCIPNSEKLLWEEGKKAPLWIGADSIRILTSEYGYGNYMGYVTLRDEPKKLELGEMQFPQNGNMVSENYSIETYFRDGIPKFISREFIVDTNGGLWSCPGLVDELDSKKIFAFFNCKDGINFPVYNPASMDQQPLLDLSKGVLVSKESIFSNVTGAQNRVRDVVNTIIPLTLLFTDLGRLWIKLRIGAWFVFDLPQYNVELLQNRTTAIIVPKRNDCEYYPINDKSILVRTPKKLTLYNMPGELCDEFTYNNIVSRFPHSKLLGRFNIGGEIIDESDIYRGPLNRYRKNILPRNKINIIGALNGIIVYYYLDEDNKVYISYL